MTSTSLKEAFTRIYQREAWGKGKGSGGGSSPVYCAQYLQWLGQQLSTRKLASVLDIGCGDWQLYKGFTWPVSVRYVGVDIVEGNVDQNNLLHSTHRIKFVCANVVNPHVLMTLWRAYGPFDMVLIKDVMQHWSNDEIAMFLATMKNLEWGMIVAVNNWRHFRSPGKNEQPRNIKNQYRWAPIDMRAYGFKEEFYYPAGKFKQVATLTNMEGVL